MSVKFKLVANPTFTAKVVFPIPGGEEASVEMTFKHRTRDEFKDFLNTMVDKSDEELFLDMVSGWELVDAFNEANVKILLQNYLSVARHTLDTYIAEQGAVRNNALGK